MKVDDKSNEITAIPLLLNSLDLNDCIVTIDAMGCQTDITRTIIERDANYIIAIIAVRLNSTTIKIVCSTADFPRSSIFFSFPSPPNQKVMDLEVTPRRISTPFPSPFQDY